MKKSIIAGLAIALLQIGAYGCEPGYRRPYGVSGRQQIQRERIREGTREGDLTRREAGRLRERSTEIADDRRGAIADDGRIDRRERRRIQHEQNQLGTDIYEQRHDDDRR